MPAGLQHTSATVITSGLLCLAAAALIYQTQRVEWVAMPVVALSGLLLSPDLDVERGSIANHHARRIGWLFGAAWRVYWYPYALAIPHRHWLSHIPIASTLGRLVYLLWWLPLVINPLPWAWIATGALGLVVVDLLHIIMDWI